VGPRSGAYPACSRPTQPLLLSRPPPGPRVSSLRLLVAPWRDPSQFVLTPCIGLLRSSCSRAGFRRLKGADGPEGVPDGRVVCDFLRRLRAPVDPLQTLADRELGAREKDPYAPGAVPGGRRRPLTGRPSPTPQPSPSTVASLRQGPPPGIRAPTTRSGDDTQHSVPTTYHLPPQRPTPPPWPQRTPGSPDPSPGSPTTSLAHRVWFPLPFCPND